MSSNDIKTLESNHHDGPYSPDANSLEKGSSVVTLDDSEDPKKMSSLKKYFIILVIFTAGSTFSSSSPASQPLIGFQPA